MNQEKHCNICLYSYLENEKLGSKTITTQMCRNPDYNSPDYTHEMLMEDWGKGYCRFWTPRLQK